MQTSSLLLHTACLKHSNKVITQIQIQLLFIMGEQIPALEKLLSEILFSVPEDCGMKQKIFHYLKKQHKK